MSFEDVYCFFMFILFFSILPICAFFGLRKLAYSVPVFIKKVWTLIKCFFVILWELTKDVFAIFSSIPKNSGENNNTVC